MSDLQQAINIYKKEIDDLEYSISICACCEPLDTEILTNLIGQRTHKIGFLEELEEIKILVEIRE